MSGQDDGGARRLTVGLNLLWLVPGDVGGTEDYAITFVRQLADVAGLDLVAFCQPSLVDAYPELEDWATVVVTPRCGRARGLRLVYENTWLPQQLRAGRHPVDVVHHLGGTVPPTVRQPGVLTVYDLQPLTHPERFGALKRTWLGAILPQSVRRARAVFTLSRYVGRQLHATLGTPDEQVVVVPPGPLPAGAPVAVGGASVDPATVRERYGLVGPVLLYPAIAYGHKNHQILVRALPKVLAQHPTATLVCTGRPGPVDDDVTSLAQALGVSHAVRRLGRIPRTDLAALYRTASALVFPSTHEGFGLPLLEAMENACPILAADASAIPEIVGDCGQLITPDDPAAWADAITLLLDDEARRRTLSDAATSGRSRFSWDTTLDRTLATYHQAAA